MIDYSIEMRKHSQILSGQLKRNQILKIDFIKEWIQIQDIPTKVKL